MTDETPGLEPAEGADLLSVESPTTPQEPEAPPVEDKAPDAEPPPRDDEGKFISPKVQQRIDRLTWEREQARREAEFYRTQAAPRPEPVKPAAEKLPTLEQFGYDEAKYQAALIEHAAKQAESIVERRLREADEQRAEQKRLETFAERQRAFATTTPDFEDKVLRDPTLPITQGMRDVILDSDSGPELAYYLANNRELAEQIARLPAHLAALEMGRLEGRMSAQKEAAKRPVVTKAPPPPPTVDTTETEVDRDPEKMSPDEWLKWRNKQLRKPRK